jgi:hypothetical protein
MRRVPLEQRGTRVDTGQWTDFEVQLFNLVGEEFQRLRPGLFKEMIFSERLRATQVMLDALDKFVEETTPWK